MANTGSKSSGASALMPSNGGSTSDTGGAPTPGAGQAQAPLGDSSAVTVADDAGKSQDFTSAVLDGKSSSDAPKTDAETVVDALASPAAGEEDDFSIPPTGREHWGEGGQFMINEQGYRVRVPATEGE